MSTIAAHACVHVWCCNYCQTLCCINKQTTRSVVSHSHMTSYYGARSLNFVVVVVVVVVPVVVLLFHWKSSHNTEIGP